MQSANCHLIPMNYCNVCVGICDILSVAEARILQFGSTGFVVGFYEQDIKNKNIHMRTGIVVL